MRQRDRGSSTDSDAYGTLFGSDDDDESLFEDDTDTGQRSRASDGPGHADGAGRPMPRPSDGSHGHRSTDHRTGRIIAIGAVFVVAVLAVATWLVVIPIYQHFTPANYSGTGSGTVRITVMPNDGAASIASSLHKQGVVASDQAFTSAANDNSKSRNIQPGTYVLHKKMSGAAALSLMLKPSARLNDDTVVSEGLNTLDVAKRLEAAPCAADADKSAVCGPGFSATSVRAALNDIKALGIPADFTVSGAQPPSVEGFLYPAKYYFPETSSPQAALNQMIAKFSDEVRSTDFTTRAKANRWTPYQQLIAASIAQSEAKYPADMKKVVRVILNRLASKTPLRIDATSAYGAKLKGLDPTKIIYAQIDSPYNSYTHDGLPPTPISNPGADALAGAAAPTPGNWLYYVNSDAQGHLFFTNSESAFIKAAAKCKKNNWGCG